MHSSKRRHCALQDMGYFSWQRLPGGCPSNVQQKHLPSRIPNAKSGSTNKQCDEVGGRLQNAKNESCDQGLAPSRSTVPSKKLQSKLGAKGSYSPVASKYLGQCQIKQGAKL